ncbi:uncharacterized protein LOC129789028 [Lutzomyia longipalpis]|uniref:uncharacterized protein LOC129789028 n=1 Tax=Lutzomyia longipalpis TaxID=7200 RepID=UPI00248408D8|nr:uncharacterized protein LOC129789028 [Lutzomyia longipalpis]
MKKLFLLSLAFVVISAKFPTNVKKCSYGDSQCLIQSSEEVLRSAGNGFPGLNLIPIDPLRVDKVDIRQNSESPVNINLFFRDIILNGLSQLKVYKMQGFVENPRKIEMRARLDKLVLNANYKARGRILLLPINGEGKCNLTFDNWDAGWRFTVNKVEKNNKEYVKVENSKLFFNTTRLHMDFENLFNGDRALSDNMNQFLNENWNVILTELKPARLMLFPKFYKMSLVDPSPRFPTMNSSMHQKLINFPGKLYIQFLLILQSSQVYYVYENYICINCINFFHLTIEQYKSNDFSTIQGYFISHIQQDKNAVFAEKITMDKWKIFLFLNLCALSCAMSPHTPCPFGDSDCVVNLFNSIISLFGDEDTDFQALDPLLIENATLATKFTPTVHFKLFLLNSKLHGLQSLKALRATAIEEDFMGKENEIVFTAPQLTLHGPYKMKGKFHLIPLISSGMCNITIYNVELAVKYTLDKITLNGETYLKTTSTMVDVKPGDMRTQMDNIFNTNPEIDEAVHLYINENWRDVFKDMKPSVTKTFSKITEDVFNAISTKVPLKLFLQVN